MMWHSSHFKHKLSYRMSENFSAHCPSEKTSLSIMYFLSARSFLLSQKITLSTVCFLSVSKNSVLSICLEMQCTLYLSLSTVYSLYASRYSDFLSKYNFCLPPVSVYILNPSLSYCLRFYSMSQNIKFFVTHSFTALGYNIQAP